MTRNDLVTLQVTSPCEHGKRHEFAELPLGVEFATFACTTAKGVPRLHLVTAAKYPEAVTRR